jgi:hypothetical protein
MPTRTTQLEYQTVGFKSSDNKYFRQSEDAFAEVGLSLKTCTTDPDVIVHLTPHAQMRKLYPQVANVQLSVTDRGKSPVQIHINGENWNRIPTHLGSEYKKLHDYRVALLSHEFAHAYGHDHVSCACVGCISDVRQQPSRALGGCKPTTKVVFNPKSPHSNVNF